jgi:leucyl-tRNA synthetase
VLNEYGTGSIMGVPFHDERDCAFALKNNLPMIQVIEGDEEANLDNCLMKNSDDLSGLNRNEAFNKII